MWQMTPVTGEATAGADVLRWPLVGRLLKHRHARTFLQVVLLIAAGVLVLHGLVGPQVAPGNLSTVLTWVHYRGLLVVALLAAGNLFCAGCPFVLVRDLGRRIHAPARLWPKKLRGKWLAIVLFVGVLFSILLHRRCRRSSSRFESGQPASPVARRTASLDGERRRPPAGLCSGAVNWACIYPRRSATLTAHSAWTAFTPVHTTTLPSRFVRQASSWPMLVVDPVLGGWLTARISLCSRCCLCLGRC
jgi:hypothetical protein